MDSFEVCETPKHLKTCIIKKNSLYVRWLLVEDKTWNIPAWPEVDGDRNNFRTVSLKDLATRTEVSEPIPVTPVTEPARKLRASPNVASVDLPPKVTGPRCWLGDNENMKDGLMKDGLQVIMTQAQINDQIIHGLSDGPYCKERLVTKGLESQIYRELATRRKFKILTIGNWPRVCTG